VEDREQEFFHRSLRDWSIGLVPWVAKPISAEKKSIGGRAITTRRRSSSGRAAESQPLTRPSSNEQDNLGGGRLNATDRVCRVPQGLRGGGHGQHSALCRANTASIRAASPSGSGSAASAPFAATRCQLHDGGHRRRRWRLRVSLGSPRTAF
jgi:hypothetical protein